MKQPGARLRELATRVCGAATLERLIDPIIADLQAESRDAGERGAPWRRRLVVAAGYYGFWKAIALHAVLALSGGGGRAPEGSTVGRAIGLSCVAFTCMTVALVLPPLVNGAGWSGAAADRVLMVVYLIPQALPLSIPAGVCVGVLCAMRARRLTLHHVRSVLAIGIVATGLAWGLMEWGVPYANQRFREHLFAQLGGDGRGVHLEPGLNELGLSNLALRADPAAVRHYHVLAALCLATIPLSLFALGLAPRLRRPGSAVLAAIMACLGYYAAIWALDDFSLIGTTAAVLVAWMPNAVFLAGASVLLHRGSRTS